MENKINIKKELEKISEIKDDIIREKVGNEILMSLIVEFWNTYSELVEGIESHVEIKEMAHAVHQIQGIIAIRELKRLNSPLIRG
jgi:hypothetical protein